MGRLQRSPREGPASANSAESARQAADVALAAGARALAEKSQGARCGSSRYSARWLTHLAWVSMVVRKRLAFADGCAAIGYSVTWPPERV
jgi:hypothetical protein